MDLSVIPVFISSVKNVLGIVKEAKELLPDSPQKTAATKKIEEAENSLKIAETEAAKAMGHELCQCTFPSQIMLYDRSKNVDRCPGCGDEIKRSTRKKWPLQSHRK